MLATADKWCLKLVDQALRVGVDKGSLRNSRQDDNELIATHTGQDMGLPHRIFQLSGCVGNQFIAAGMTGGIIDEFKVIQIDEQEGSFGIVRQAFFRQKLLQTAAIREIRQLIVIRHSIDLFIPLFAVRNIGKRTNDPDRLVRVAVQHFAPGVEPDIVAVF